jgi:hypothetical protein
MPNAELTKSLLDQLKDMRPGAAGVMIKNTDLVDADIPGIAEPDLDGRAKWLVSKLPFKCEFHPAQNTLNYVFKRQSAD